MNQQSFSYGIDRMTVASALRLARGECAGVIDDEARRRITESAARVARIVERGDLVYGVNTGFGPLCTTTISPADTRKLQTSILRSHSCGVGENLPPFVAKLMMILKIHALARGFSGIAPETLDRMVWHIDRDLIPVVPSQGSVGASGDLAPLAHLFLPLIGLGYVETEGEIVATGRLFEQEGVAPLELGPKEGLALINGTQFITANAVVALERLLNCLDCADIIGAMSLESLLGSVKPFHARLHELRPYAGTSYVAFRLRQLLHGSERVASHERCERVQDPYSIRCMPQVHGASRHGWRHLKELVDVELESVTDNPVIIDDQLTISGGNFHGQPLALPLDYVAVAASELGNISDRRTYLLLGGHDGVLPKLLMTDVGINSGFMIPQYTSAALVTENKTMCFPASADSIPTSLGQEDHVSMGSISARKLLRILDNVENILAVELLCTAQAFDFNKHLRSGPVLDRCHAVVRDRIDHAVEDRVLGDDLVQARAIIAERELAREAEVAAERCGLELTPEEHRAFRLE